MCSRCVCFVCVCLSFIRVIVVYRVAFMLCSMCISVLLCFGACVLLLLFDAIDFLCLVVFVSC